MIRSAIREQVQQRSMDSGTIVLASDTNIWIDLAVRSLWNAYAWPFKSTSTTLSTTANSKVLVLPAGVQEIKKLINTASLGVLQPRNERFLQGLFPDDTQTSYPIFYCDGGLQQAANMTAPPQRVLHLYPVPDKVYALSFRYEALPQLPSAQATPDSAYMPFPEDFDEAVIHWCLMRYYQLIGDALNLNLSKSFYEMELQRLVALYSSMTETFPMIDSELDSYFGNSWSGMS